MTLRAYDSAADVGQTYFWDDFSGALYNNRLWSGLAGNGYIVYYSPSCLNGQLRVHSRGSNFYELYQADRSFGVDRKLEVTWRNYIPYLTDFQGRWGMRGADSTTNSFFFGYDSAVGANWLIGSISGGTSTIVSTGIAADTDFHEFRIATSPGFLNFFLDEVSVGVITTNIPTGSLCPHCRSTSLSTGERDVFVDYIEVYSERV